MDSVGRRGGGTVRVQKIRSPKTSVKNRLGVGILYPDRHARPMHLLLCEETWRSCLCKRGGGGKPTCLPRWMEGPRPTCLLDHSAHPSPQYKNFRLSSQLSENIHLYPPSTKSHFNPCKYKPFTFPRQKCQHQPTIVLKNISTTLGQSHEA